MRLLLRMPWLGEKIARQKGERNQGKVAGLTPGNYDAFTTARVKRRWDAKSRSYDIVTWIEAKGGGSKLRRRLWSGVEGGRVLEIGVGTGANLKHHPPNAQVTAIDISLGMLERACSRAARLRKDAALVAMDAQALSFTSASFDTVAATYVFCTVPDPVLGLREASRVLKPEGRLLLLEHVRLPGALGRIMDWLNPLTVALMGSNINRDTVANVQKAGFTVETERSYLWGLVKLIVARPNRSFPRLKK